MGRAAYKEPSTKPPATRAAIPFLSTFDTRWLGLYTGPAHDDEDMTLSIRNSIPLYRADWNCVGGAGLWRAGAYMFVQKQGNASHKGKGMGKGRGGGDIYMYQFSARYPWLFLGVYIQSQLFTGGLGIMTCRIHCIFLISRPTPIIYESYTNLSTIS